jgi:hypothetical protein
MFVFALTCGCWRTADSSRSSSQEPADAAAAPAQFESADREQPPLSAPLVSGRALEPSSLAVVPSESNDASYVGSERCQSCHQQRHESYLKSHHSRSLTRVDATNELSEGTIEHSLSHRRYEIVRRDGKLWHRETLLEANDGGAPREPLVMAEFPVEYVMGSGKFAKGYLVRDGRYLLQSPVTWYAGGTSESGTGTLGVSPGYDSPFNAGFGRAVTDECMFCHSGTLTRSDNRHFFTVTESSIGCERCHGPGESHVSHYQKLALNGPDAADPSFHESIVHPGKLNRLQSDSLCGQCHCQGEAQVPVAGRSEWEFRPGDDFARFKMNYDAVVGDQPNTRFVGHFPQLHASKCYQGSETMTCVTCHDPHQHAEGRSRLDLQRQQCAQCHQDQSCGVPLPDRIERNENQCVICHMPRTESEVPHTSTTNHRIAIYDQPGDSAIAPASSSDRTQKPRLQEVHIAALQNPPAEMTAGEAAVMQALGTYWLFRKHLGDPRMTSLAGLAGDSMQQVMQSGHGNDEIHANLAMLTYLQIPMVPPGPQQQVTVAGLWEWAMGFAQQALERKSSAGESREAALEVAGRFLYRAGQHQSAASVYDELTKRRRRKEDWATLGICLAQLGDLQGSRSALRESIRINGGDPDLYETLAIVLSPSDAKEATRLRALADRIRNQWAGASADQ